MKRDKHVIYRYRDKYTGRFISSNLIKAEQDIFGRPLHNFNKEVYPKLYVKKENLMERLYAWITK